MGNIDRDNITFLHRFHWRGLSVSARRYMAVQITSFVVIY